MSAFSSKRVLGIDFFDGAVEEAVEWVARNGGLVIAPAGPSIIALQTDAAYREAIAQADLAVADSGWMVVFWRILHGEKLTRISGLKFFKRLLELPEVRTARNLFWVLPSDKAQVKTLAWAQAEQFPLTNNDLYVAPRYLEGHAPLAASEHGEVGSRPGASSGDAVEQHTGHDPASAVSYGAASSVRPSIEDERLLAIIRERRPKHIVIAIGGGMQDKIGSYIKSNCGYRPGIYCIGAAPGFVTGDQVRIPMWADRFYLGWIFRVFAQPRAVGPRFWSARKLPWLIWKYRRDMPPLLTH
jgi:UDP-N-acetyl-D-mannosaminuronic acid transferase (WecB/TagA/CpsF family)